MRICSSSALTVCRTWSLPGNRSRQTWCLLAVAAVNHEGCGMQRQSWRECSSSARSRSSRRPRNVPIRVVPLSLCTWSSRDGPENPAARPRCFHQSRSDPKSRRRWRRQLQTKVGTGPAPVLAMRLWLPLWQRFASSASPRLRSHPLEKGIEKLRSYAASAPPESRDARESWQQHRKLEDSTTPRSLRVHRVPSAVLYLSMLPPFSSPIPLSSLPLAPPLAPPHFPLSSSSPRHLFSN